MTTLKFPLRLCFTELLVLLLSVPLATVAWAAQERTAASDTGDVAAIIMSHRIKEAEIRLQELQLSLEREKVSLARAREEDAVRIAIFGRQLWYHPLILFAVIGIVMTGVFLSYLQVKRDLVAGQAQESSLELSGAGLSIRSPVIGLLILIVSLGFFYLYLKEVYHITETTPVARGGEIAPVAGAVPPTKQSGKAENSGAAAR